MAIVWTKGCCWRSSGNKALWAQQNSGATLWLSFCFSQIFSTHVALWWLITSQVVGAITNHMLLPRKRAYPKIAFSCGRLRMKRFDPGEYPSIWRQNQIAGLLYIDVFISHLIPDHGCKTPNPLSTIVLVCQIVFLLCIYIYMYMYIYVYIFHHSTAAKS